MRLHYLTAGLGMGLVSSFQPHFYRSYRSDVSSVSDTILHQSSAGQPSATTHSISIEYCTGCRWMLRAFWTAQELLTTFEDEIDAITIIPSASKGIFSVVLDDDKQLWDRKEKAGFPTPKNLKQIVRDCIEPEKFLGHSDTEERQQAYSGDEKDDTAESSRQAPQSPIVADKSELPSPTVTITYCTGCKWLLRTAYYGQELLTTFGEEIKSVTLVPSKPPAKGGIFSVHLDGELIFDRSTESRFPEVKELKQLIRDKVVPEKDLGHSDVKVEELDDEIAAEQRRFFGVD
eukprot:scaffold22589_cov138-Cylindrotheca_fusiformis.AAC.19